MEVNGIPNRNPIHWKNIIWSNKKNKKNFLVNVIKSSRRFVHTNITKSNESFKNDSFPKKFYQCMASVAMCIAMFGFATMLCDN